MTDDMPQDRRAPVLSKSLRIVLLEAAIVLCFAVYVYWLFSMQVLLSDTYRTQSRTVSSQVSRIPAQRGEIFDRNATVPMVINTDSFAVEITPAEIPAGYYDTVASRLAQYLGVSKFDIDKRIPEKLRKSYTAITVRSNVSFETISNIAENKIDLPGVSWVSRPIRNYVETGSLSHIIGYVGDITQDDGRKLMFDKLDFISDKYDELSRIVSDPSVISNPHAIYDAFIFRAGETAAKYT